MRSKNYNNLKTKQLVNLLYDTIENMYSDEVTDGNFQVPLVVTPKLRKSIAKTYNIANILKNKMKNGTY